MNRRRFLKFLGVGAAAGAVAPHLLLQKDLASVAAESDADYYRRRRAEVGPGGWVSYRFKYTVTYPPARSPFPRIRMIDAVAS